MKTKFFVVLFLIVFSVSGQGAGYPSDLVYYSKLDSSADITSPQVGDCGSSDASSFVSGVTGKAVDLPNGGMKVNIPLKNGLPVEKGCIEFWSKFTDSDSTYDSSAACFLVFKRAGAVCGSFYITPNNGDAKYGFNCNFPYLAQFASFPGFGFSYPYTTIFGEKDYNAWHHYAIVWNTNGIAGTTHSVRVYLDEAVVLSREADGCDFANYALAISDPMTLELGGGGLELLFDEFRVWSTDRTEFPVGPIEPTQDAVVVSDVTAKQHYPWCGKIDIGYTVAGATDGLLVKISVRDNDNDVTYEAKTFDVAPTATVGAHAVVWDATKDGVNKVSRNMVATVSLIVPEN